MNEIALLGKKLGMTREFYKTGQLVPVTVLKMEKARVIQVIDQEKRGYKAVQLGYGKIKNSKLTKAMKGYFTKKNTEAKKRLKYWFEKFDISAWWNKKIEELSKGMAQKVQFVVTVLHQPKLLIFDEPFSGFDPINAKLIAQEILDKVERDNITDLSNKNISEVIPFIASADMYVGNDSFGSHISSQSGKPSLVILLDSPKAYTDYTPNHIRIIPEGYDINNITHGSEIDPNLIKVEQVYKSILSYT